MRYLLLLVFSYLIVIPSAKSQCPVPLIVSPSGGEEVAVGEEITVEYLITNPDIDSSWWGFDSHVDFYYSINSGSEWIYVDSIPVDSSLALDNSILEFNWTIPNTVTDNCLIKIIKFKTWCWDETEEPFKIVSRVTEENGSNNKSQVNVYPNPAYEGQQITVAFLDHIFETAILYDFNGRMVHQVNNVSENSLNIQTIGLSKGLYILYLIREGETLVHKITVN